MSPSGAIAVGTLAVLVSGVSLIGICEASAFWRGASRELTLGLVLPEGRGRGSFVMNGEVAYPGMGGRACPALLSAIACKSQTC